MCLASLECGYPLLPHLLPHSPCLPYPVRLGRGPHCQRWWMPTLYTRVFLNPGCVRVCLWWCTGFILSMHTGLGRKQLSQTHSTHEVGVGRRVLAKSWSQKKTKKPEEPGWGQGGDLSASLEPPQPHPVRHWGPLSQHQEGLRWGGEG